VYRKDHGLTQAQLGEILGVSDATITHIETGKRPVTPQNAIAWEEKIGISRAVLCPEIFKDASAEPQEWEAA
jgi:transcriptional regulator with XRE-family HTH domain